MSTPGTSAAGPSVVAEWPAVGDVVVDWNHSRGQRMVVKKITATQVVCSTGRSETRFRRRDLSRIGAGDWDGSTLIRPADERFVRYEAKQERLRVAGEVEGLVIRFRRDGDIAAAIEAHRLLSEYLASANGGDLDA